MARLVFLGGELQVRNLPYCMFGTGEIPIK